MNKTQIKNEMEAIARKKSGTSTKIDDMLVSQHNKSDLSQRMGTHHKNDWTHSEAQMDSFDFPGFISDYIEYASQRTDAPKEYHYVCALNIISILSDRRRKIGTMIQDIYPNLYITILGDSTLSRKTASVGIMEDFLEKLYITDMDKLPNSFSPESFVELMAENSSGYIINDEAGAFLNTMKKSYMADMKEILTLFYDGKGYKRTLKKGKNKDSEFNVINPYLDIFFATTPQNFTLGSEAIDVRSGWLARFIFCFPRYGRETRPVSFDTKKRGEIQKEINMAGLHIKQWLRAQNHKPSTVAPEAQKMWQDWCVVGEKQLISQDDPVANAILGRLHISALKLALLHSLSRKSLIVSTSDMKSAIHVCDTFFYPCGVNVLRAVENQNQIDRDARIMEKVVDTLKRRGGTTTRTDLLQMTKMTLKPFEDIVDAMVEGRQIREFVSEDSGQRPRIMYTLLKEGV